MTTEFLQYLVEQSSGIVIALILIMRVDRRMDELTTSINHLSELISVNIFKEDEEKKDDLKNRENEIRENLDTTNFQIHAKKVDLKKEGAKNIRRISKPAKSRKQA